jgi:sigma-B regulation protein RsbU (phosphoserine phosphatase)
VKVLAIEDQPVAALQLRAVLKSLGYDAELVTNGSDAWQALRQGGFRVVVSDWRMPGMDGLDLCRMVRSRGGDYVYYILISSTKITKESRAEALAAGVDDFLPKPVEPDELGMRLHVAERIINLSAQVKQLESFIPICSHCKKIRDDRKYWQEIETYFAQQKGTRFSHGICPDCYQHVLAPQLRELGIDPTLPPGSEDKF